MHGNHAHHNRVRAALLEDVHAEACITRSAERKIGRASFFQTVDSVLMIADDHLGNSRGMSRGQFLKTRNVYRLKFSGQLDLRRTAWRKDQVAYFLRRIQHLASHGNACGWWWTAFLGS